jgi:hypothetical protein
MITDERLRWLSIPDYLPSEPGQIAAELLSARARIRELETALREVQAHGYFTSKHLVDAVLPPLETPAKQGPKVEHGPGCCCVGCLEDRAS